MVTTYKKLKHLEDMAHENKVNSVQEYVDKAVKFAQDGKLNAAVSAAMRQIGEFVRGGRHGEGGGGGGGE